MSRVYSARSHLVLKPLHNVAAMKRFLAVLALLVLAGCTAEGAVEPPVEPPPCDQAFGKWADAGFSGSVAISTGGKLDCAAGYGMADVEAGRPNTADTVFDIGSVTKAFTAAAVFALVDSGRLTLDTTAGEVLPALRGPVAGATVEQLLLHTSGLGGTFGDGDSTPLDRDAALAAIDALELAFPPGTDNLYSNAGYTLLAIMIDELSGTGYREFVTSELPAGVAGGFWNGEPAAPGPRAVGYVDGGQRGEMGDFVGPHWALDGNGGLAMTTVDLAAWTRALFTGGVVSAESAAAIAEPGFDLGDGQSETPGWVAQDDSAFGVPFLAAAGGGGDVGHNVVVVWVPDHDRVVTIASNSPELSAEDLLGAVGPALLADEPLPVPPDPADLSGPAATVGTYELDTGGSFDVTAEDNQVTISANGADAVAVLFPTDEDVAGHEAMVLELLAGRTQEGREERARLEESLGPISGVEVAGTVFDDEFRTYVTVTSGERTVLGWYALNRAGGIEGATLPEPTDPPALPLVADGDSYRPDDATGNGPEVTVAFGDGKVTVTGPGGPVDAVLAG
jgi:CubicO group peptidase (beta-lactamase class C family)